MFEFTRDADADVTAEAAPSVVKEAVQRDYVVVIPLPVLPSQPVG